MLGQGVKSVSDYDNEAMAAKANKLALMTHQQNFDDANALRAAAQGFGDDSEANYRAILGTGNVGAAQAYRKANFDNQKTQADIGLSKSHAANFDSEVAGRQLDQKIKAHDYHLQQLGALTDPSQIDAWATQGVKDGVLGMQESMAGAQAMKAYAAQYGFEAAKQQAMKGGVSALKQLEMTQQQLIADNANKTSRQNNADTNQTHITTTGMTNATTQRGQNMVDARQKQQLDQPEYKTDADGNYIALPKKVAPGTSITAQPVLDASGKPIGAGTNGKPLTETQGKATTFAARMQDAEGTIQKLEAQGVSGSDLRTIAAASDYTNWLASPQGQQYRQAQENWVTANLRQESGAAIGKDEMRKDVRKFFPAINDGPEVIAQKAQARAVAARGMVAQAGPGARQIPAIVGAAQSSTGLPSADAITAELARRGH
jgi:hypothetical protein